MLTLWRYPAILCTDIPAMQGLIRTGMRCRFDPNAKVKKEGLVLIVMHHKAGQRQIDAVTRAIEKMGLTAAPIAVNARVTTPIRGNE